MMSNFKHPGKLRMLPPPGILPQTPPHFLWAFLIPCRVRGRIPRMPAASKEQQEIDSCRLF